MGVLLALLVCVACLRYSDLESLSSAELLAQGFEQGIGLSGIGQNARHQQTAYQRTGCGQSQRVIV